MKFSWIVPALCIGSCFAQGLESATATLSPAGEAGYEAWFSFRLLPFEGPAFAGAPYSAEEVSSGGAVRKLYRDSSGRTRVERRLSMGRQDGPTIVEIDDPVAGFRYVLDQQARVAHRYRAPETADEVAEEFLPVATADAGHPVARATVKSMRRAAQVARLPVPEGPAPEDIGNREIEGVQVNGTRLIRTIPGGAGQRILMSEIWTSAELRLVVLSKVTDSEAGETIVRLKNLSRNEPAALLFQIPASYSIRDESATFQIHFTAPSR